MNHLAMQAAEMQTFNVRVALPKGMALGAYRHQRRTMVDRLLRAAYDANHSPIGRVVFDHSDDVLFGNSWNWHAQLWAVPFAIDPS